LPDDLRKMDENQFEKVVSWLKEKTDNFKKFPEEIFLANNQFLSILRCIFGMTRVNFARKTGINTETLRFIEMGREQNKIKSFAIARRWCLKIEKFLQNNKPVEISKALLFWKILKDRQTGEKDKRREEEIKKILQNLNLPKDLRKMNEKQFIELFNTIKEITQDFKTIPPELITARSDIILILRLITGLGREEFCILTKTPIDSLRHVERGRIPIKNATPALRWVEKFIKVFREREIKLESAIAAFRKFKGEKEEKEKIIPLAKMNLKNATQLFEKVKKLTNNFTSFPFQEIRREPRIISVVRVLMDKTVPQFAKLIKKDESWVRRWERGSIKISLKNALFFSKKLEELVKTINPSKKVFIQNFKKLHLVRKKEVNQRVKSMLNTLKSLQPTESEKEVVEILEELKIPFTLHANVEGAKRFLNIDIAIPDEEKPTLLIEVTQMSKNDENLVNKLILSDHKFQMIKIKHQNVKTISFVKLKEEIEKENVKKVLQTHLLATDFLFINELKKLRKLLEKWEKYP
jgi:DNA-binding transcriptional regulator YiaG